jgi:ADP-heptose:LPS heptosyltransferase
LTKKILVIRFSSIGDIVLTTPVTRALSRQSGAEVHFLTKETFAPLLLANPYVAKVICLRDDFAGMISELKAEGYDYVVDLHHNLRTQRIKRALGRPASSFHKLNFQKWLLVRFGINHLPDIHIVDRYMAAAARFKLVKDGSGLDFFIPSGKEVDTLSCYGLPPGSYVAIVIGAAHETKCLTAEQISRLCNGMKKPVILLGGKDEMGKAQKIAEAASAANLRNAVGQLDLIESASVLQQSGVVITHDTGLMHMAAALKKPQVVIWGNTIPAFGMYPYYGDEKIPWISIENTQLKCRPCSKLGFPACPKGHFKCILDHDMDNVARAAGSLFSISAG